APLPAAASGRLLPAPASDRARLALAHVDDVVASIIALIEAPAPPPIVAIAGARPEGYRWREIFEAAAQAVGSKARLARAPAWTIAGAGVISEALGRFSRDAPIFTGGKAREIPHPE